MMTTRIGAALVLLALATIGCGDTEESDTVPKPVCIDEPDVPALSWEPCTAAPEAECATLDVPLDYADPAGETLGVRVLRLPATDPAQRIGTLVIINGGATVAGLGKDGFGHSNVYRVFAPTLYERFDVVYLDRRGIGESDHFDCGISPDVMARFRALPHEPANDAEWQEVDSVYADIWASCSANNSMQRLAAFGSENVARDLDRLRQALGEKDLNLYAVSYSTHIALSYAAQFPGCARAVALDSTVYPPKVSLLDYHATVSTAFDDTLTQFFDACAADPACAFHGGEAAQSIAASFDQLALPTGTLTPSDLAMGATSVLGNGSADFGKLAKALATVEAGDPSAFVAAGDAYRGNRPDGTYDTEFPYFAIQHADHACPDLDLESAKQEWAKLVERAPRVGTVYPLYALSCLHWEAGRQGPMNISAPGAPPLLVAGGSHDPGTPFEAAEQVVGELNNGSHLLRYDGEGHGYLLRSECVRSAFTSYLTNPEDYSPPVSCAE